ncbi:UNVERIFIED_CONTAM: hypothetical protein GTU68_057235 [Idotea baltica]|nr:hypothetical protein [Idotea baltica]
MGCLPSKLNLIIHGSQGSGDSNGEDSSNKTYSWDKRKKVDPADYTIENLTDGEKGRLPGTINGQQFIVQNCTSSKLFLFDDINTITIDDCTDCSIYVGPVAGR